MFRSLFRLFLPPLPEWDITVKWDAASQTWFQRVWRNGVLMNSRFVANTREEAVAAVAKTSQCKPRQVRVEKDGVVR